MKNEKPKISVITVVYNGEDVLLKTIESVRNQSYTNIEYIIIDGVSKDNTIEIIKENETSVSFWISEKDKGLYDAMNKGLHKATGDYVIFLNAGDTFFDSETIENVFKPTSVYSDIYYGETLIVDKEGGVIGFRRLRAPEKLTWKSFRMGMLVCHQSIFIKKEITSDYNLAYPHAADYEWVLRALKKADTIQNTHQVLSKFEAGGYSSKHVKESNMDRFKIMRKYYGLLVTLFFHGIMLFRLAFTYLKTGRMQ